MKHWIVFWVSRVNGIIVDHNDLEDSESPLIVRGETLLDAYYEALPLVEMRSIDEGATAYKITDIGIVEDDVF